MKKVTIEIEFEESDLQNSDDVMTRALGTAVEVSAQLSKAGMLKTELGLVGAMMLREAHTRMRLCGCPECEREGGDMRRRIDHLSKVHDVAVVPLYLGKAPQA